MTSGGVKPLRSPYTPQYKTITSVGHTRPTQEIGAPTLIWHVAVWPALLQDPQDVRPEAGKYTVDELGSRRPELSETPYQAAIRSHNSKRRSLLVGGPPGQTQTVAALNDLLRRLQDRGRTIVSSDRRSELRELFELSQLRKLKDGKVTFEFAKPESRGFTLWWCDQNQRALEKPGYEPLRVRVQVETQIDYFAITFLIDVGNPWSAGQVYSSDDIPGARRKKIFQYIEQVREKCERDLLGDSDVLDKPLVPLDRVPPPHRSIEAKELDDAIVRLGEEVKKESVSPSETEILLEASKYLYAGVWEEFCRDFRFTFEDIPGPHGRVFANFRGLVMSTGGADHLRTDSDRQRSSERPPYLAANHKATAAPGKKPFCRFDKDGPEPNAVVKAYWPFIRRIKPFADYREYIACGVLNWRALYITALGSQSEYDSGDESIGRFYEVPSRNLPEHPDKNGKIWMRADRNTPLPEDSLLGPEGEEPVRYLLLTKLEPHRRQLGRIVDRINALGTMRLFALKGWTQIREASEHIRMRGQELDHILEGWIRARHEIELRYQRNRNADERNEKLSALNEYVELQLIGIAKGLDEMGEGAVGGLPYRIARSRYYAQQFKAMRETLGVGNIESWTSYNQFASRGLEPIFEFIESAGHRLRALRQRLANVMQSIQTSALVTQSEETRKNTRALELLQRSARGITVAALIGIGVAAVGPLKTLSSAVVATCADTLQRPEYSSLYSACSLHAQLAGTNENSAFLLYFCVLAGILLVLGLYVGLRRDSDMLEHRR
jgi:hypothetical protein